MTVWTGDVSGAGTDANVFLQMYGEQGHKSEELQLRNRTDNFERSQVDKFKVEAADIGPLVKVRVGHDGTGMWAGWFLDKLLIQRHPTKFSKRRAPIKRDTPKLVGRSRSSAGLPLDSDDDTGSRRKSFRRSSRYNLTDSEDDDRKRSVRQASFV